MIKKKPAIKITPKAIILNSDKPLEILIEDTIIYDLNWTYLRRSILKYGGYIINPVNRYYNWLIGVFCNA